MNLYGILDDEDSVVRWLDYEPDASKGYRYIVKRITKAKIDFSQFEDALF